MSSEWNGRWWEGTTPDWERYFPSQPATTGFNATPTMADIIALQNRAAGLEARLLYAESTIDDLRKSLADADARLQNDVSANVAKAVELIRQTIAKEMLKNLKNLSKLL